jgi:hypothetical protein
MFILDYRVTYVCSWFVERRMFILDLSNEIYDETLLNLMKHFIYLFICLFNLYIVLFFLENMRR